VDIRKPDILYVGGEYYVLIRIIDRERAKNVKQLLKAHYHAER